MHSTNNSQMLQVALNAAQAAEQVILEVYSGKFAVDFKADNSPVTVADQQAEEKIRDIIRKAFPDHGFLGEEYGSDRPGAEFVWIIDPIDGTKNFTRHIPLFGTEIALMHQGELILGVSNLPAYKQISWAEKGQGAFCNGSPLQVSTRDTLSEAYLSFSNLKYFIQKNQAAKLLDLAEDCYVSRGFGDSWAYHFVAQGSIDAIVEAKVNLWDIAAVAVIITEAGGTVTDLAGEPLTAASSSVLATNGVLHNTIVEYFRKTHT